MEYLQVLVFRCEKCSTPVQILQLSPRRSYGRGDRKEEDSMSDLKVKVVVMKDGPYEIRGEMSLSWQTIVTKEEGESVGWKEGDRIPATDGAHLCCCGHSSKKPLCDGTHQKIGSGGTETASRTAYLQQPRKISGPPVTLTDAEPLSAFARFCAEKGMIWKVARHSGESARTIVEDEAGHCPGGRLVAWDRERGRALEPEIPPSKWPNPGPSARHQRPGLSAWWNPGRRGRWNRLRGAEPGGPLTLRSLEQQTLLRREPCAGQVPRRALTLEHSAICGSRAN